VIVPMLNALDEIKVLCIFRRMSLSLDRCRMKDLRAKGHA
jgi:hypothetical protein